MESTLRSIDLTVGSLTSGTDLDACLVRQLEKQDGGISGEHSDLTRDTLSLEHEDHDLLDLSSALEKKIFLTCVYELKDYSVIRLPLHRPR